MVLKKVVFSLRYLVTLMVLQAKLKSQLDMNSIDLLPNKGDLMPVIYRRLK